MSCMACDWKTAVFILPSTRSSPSKGRKRLEDCRIYTSFYSGTLSFTGNWIGRLPYLYFLLLFFICNDTNYDWKTAVFILPSTCSWFRKARMQIGRLPYLYFLLLMVMASVWPIDWKTAVFILPSTQNKGQIALAGLEDCRIYTSFYYRKLKTASYQRFFCYSSSSKRVNRPGCSSVFCCFLSMNFKELAHWMSVTQSTLTFP